MAIGFLDRIDIHAVGKNQQLLLGIAALLLPPFYDFFAGRDRRRAVRAKAGPIGDPFRRIAQERFGAEGIGKRDQKVAAIGVAPLIENTIWRPAQFGVVVGKRCRHHRQFMRIGSDRFQIIVHRQQDV